MARDGMMLPSRSRLTAVGVPAEESNRRGCAVAEAASLSRARE